MSKSKFFDKIKDAVIERQIEDVYNEGINLYFPTSNGIEYPFSCDGLVNTKSDNGRVLKLIIEYKFNEMLNNSVSRAKVLIQVIYYLKRFENNGVILPNVCLVGDKNECFVLHTNDLLKYLDENIDWDISPSNAALNGNNTDLILKISQDASINPFIFNIDENFSFKDVATKINDLADNIQRYVRVTEHNIAKIFDYFIRNVLKSKAKLNGHELVGIFIGVLNDKMNYYQHPSNHNILVCGNKNVQIDGNAFKSFFGYFDRNYTPQESMRFTEIADRLIEDVDRRMKGDFWTPTLFVDYAHDVISKTIGEDWKEKYVVWDNCWGSGNLTRDYRFRELYCSTLFQEELNIGINYNHEATKFQFDFLNDYIPAPSELVKGTTKIPQNLIEALEQNKPIIFFINPPYGTAASGFAKNSDSKAGIAKSIINQQMLKEDIGSCSQNLYSQFLYRILTLKKLYNLTDCCICLYSPTLFLTGPSWKNFRQLFLKEFAFETGCQFQASHFADVKDNWGISFSIWKSGETSNKENFSYDLIENIDGEIQIVGNKNVYNIDNGEAASSWVKTTKKHNKKDKDCITAKSAINVSNTIKHIGNEIAYFVNDRNNVDANTSDVYLMTMPISRHVATFDIHDDNFNRCIALFSARKLIDKTWINSKDEYIAPNETHEQYQDFVNDSIIFSLFHSASNQSSLRDIDYNGRSWNVYNEFFWMSKDEIEHLANENGIQETYNDARTSNDRYIYNKLQSIILSEEAKRVLDKANEIVRKTFKYRELFHQEHPEYQITNWDSGWYQIKALAKEYAKQDYDDFVKLFKELEGKMRPMVYTLGFLK